MTGSVSASPEASFSITAAIVEHPYIFALTFILICCVVTRVRTASQVHYGNLNLGKDTPRPVPVVPYSIPFLGHTVPFAVGYLEYLQSIAYKVPSGIFALKIGGSVHNMIMSPSISREFYNRPNLPLDFESIVLRGLTYAFGDRGKWTEYNKTNYDDLWGVNKITHGLMKEPFLTEGTTRVVQAVEEKTWNMVSGNSSWVDHSQWERAAKVEIVSIQPKDGSFVAEADLFSLSRNFVGDIASSLLFGRAFLDNNPQILEDLWLLDSKVTILMLGLPWWLLPGVPAAIRARKRLIEAVREHHKALMDVIDGKDPGYRYNDVSDVSSFIWERVRGFHRIQVDGFMYGIADMSILWAMNVNANQVIFWMLYYLYSQPELLEEIRTEIKPFVQVIQAKSEGLPIKEAPRLKMDIESLHQKCHSLKGAFLETMRREVAFSSYRIATDDMVISESQEDALKVGKTYPEKFFIKKGELVFVSSIVQQSNPLYYDQPEKFNHKRFLTKTLNEKGEEETAVEYGLMRPWGGGKTMCKGRNFAEREVLAFVAGIITIWDMEPANGGTWQHPGNLPTVGTYSPKKDIRVRLWRRKL